MIDESDKIVYTAVGAKNLSHNFAKTVIVVAKADGTKQSINLSKLPEEDVVFEEEMNLHALKSLSVLPSTDMP